MSALVSVIVPLYNTESYIDKAIQSIVDQSYTNWELLICDDASKDNSLGVAQKWEQRDSRIKIFTNTENKGHVFTYNRLFAEAKGDYVMIQDSDDWSNRERIAKQVNILQQFSVGMCVTNSVFFNSLGESRYWPNRESGMIDIYTEEHWAPATNMFRRSVLQEIGGLNEYFDRLTSMDRYFIMEVLDRFKGYYLDEYLYYVHVREDSDHRSIDLTHPMALRKVVITDVYNELKRQRMNQGTDWLKEKNFPALEAYERKMINDSRFIAEKIRVFACVQIYLQKYRPALGLLIKGLKISPFYLKTYQTFIYLFRNLFVHKWKAKTK